MCDGALELLRPANEPLTLHLHGQFKNTIFCLFVAEEDRRSYFGQFGHQRAVLQPEVFLLTVQFPLQHLILTQQRIHLLQPQGQMLRLILQK